MKIIVGLGNPGEKYKQNRHNVGFMFMDYLFQIANSKNQNDILRFKYDKYILSDICEISKDILLVKPHTFMNKSGDAVKIMVDKQVSSYKFQVSKDLIVAHDDLDIPFGKFKIQMQGPKQHNGLTDIQNKLRTMDFLRIRIGVDKRPAEHRMDGEEYVLQDFTPEEQAELPELFKKIERQFEPFLQPKNNCT